MWTLSTKPGTTSAFTKGLSLSSQQVSGSRHPIFPKLVVNTLTALLCVFACLGLKTYFRFHFMVDTQTHLEVSQVCDLPLLTLSLPFYFLHFSLHLPISRTILRLALFTPVTMSHMWLNLLHRSRWASLVLVTELEVDFQRLCRIRPKPKPCPIFHELKLIMSF